MALFISTNEFDPNHVLKTQIKIKIDTYFFHGSFKANWFII